MNIRTLLSASLGILSLSFAACATPPSATRADAQPTASEAAAASCPGPKKRVAVLRFGGTGKYGAFEGWDVGEAVAAQFVSALQHTGCFLIADRTVLSEVLREHELGLAGIVRRESAVKPGQVIGAQILIKGDVTEFETGAKGNGLSLGAGNFSDSDIGVRIGGNKSRAHLAMDIRLIDATSGQVLHTERVESSSRRYGVALGLDWEEASISTDHFSKTPFGAAARDAVIEAAGLVVSHLREVQWTGQVVKSMGSQLILNVGRDSGVTTGETFIVSSVGEELIDPATGITLGHIEKRLGQIRIESVQPKYSVARMLDRFETARGDVVRR